MGLTAWTYELFQSWNILPKDDRVARPKTCEFCAKIASSARDETFVHADDALVVFEDWKPAAARHYLVCPREHITSANALSGAGRREGDDDGGDGDRARGGGGETSTASICGEMITCFCSGCGGGICVSLGTVVVCGSPANAAPARRSI